MGLSELEKAYAFYSSILVFKALVLTAVTIARRFKYQVGPNIKSDKHLGIFQKTRSSSCGGSEKVTNS